MDTLSHDQVDWIDHDWFIWSTSVFHSCFLCGDVSSRLDIEWNHRRHFDLILEENDRPRTELNNTAPTCQRITSQTALSETLKEAHDWTRVSHAGVNYREVCVDAKFHHVKT